MEMQMRILLMGGIILAIIGIRLCLIPIQILKMKMDYINNIDELIFDMKQDGFYEKDDDVDKNELLFAIEMEMRDDKTISKSFLGIIGIIIMVIFLIKMFIMLF